MPEGQGDAELNFFERVGQGGAGCGADSEAEVLAQGNGQELRVREIEVDFPQGNPPGSK
jgi:hypothetical protein